MCGSDPTRYIDPMLVQCWPAVCDGGPALNQHCVKVSRLRSGDDVGVFGLHSLPWAGSHTRDAKLRMSNAQANTGAMMGLNGHPLAQHPAINGADSSANSYRQALVPKGRVTDKTSCRGASETVAQSDFCVGLTSLALAQRRNKITIITPGD